MGNQLQAYSKAKEAPREDKSGCKKCPNCGNKLSSGSNKALCKQRIAGLLKTEADSPLAKLLGSFKDEMESTFKSLRELIADVSTSASTSKAAAIPSSPCLTAPSSGEPRTAREHSPVLVSPESSDTDSDQEEDQVVANKAAKYKLSLEEVDELLSAIYDTLEIDEEETQLTRHDKMYDALGKKKAKNQTDDGIRKELIALQEDKHNYETTAKESLRRVLQEKIEVVRKLSEVERSLSNTEDECTHLKEMNERTQDELRELANKYNGAVNEIKDLADKLKAAEGRQDEIQQKGLAEKKELQLKIDEMEEKEQELQAKIEALQADNDFTNERLTALQVRLEQLQEKTLKDHNSLVRTVHFVIEGGHHYTLYNRRMQCIH
ncbi:hypothetical protein AB205_0101980, partial [Aquarana catesbeiana]